MVAILVHQPSTHRPSMRGPAPSSILKGGTDWQIHPLPRGRAQCTGNCTRSRRTIKRRLKTPLASSSRASPAARRGGATSPSDCGLGVVHCPRRSCSTAPGFQTLRAFAQNSPNHGRFHSTAAHCRSAAAGETTLRSVPSGSGNCRNRSSPVRTSIAGTLWKDATQTPAIIARLWKNATQMPAT